MTRAQFEEAMEAVWLEVLSQSHRQFPRPNTDRQIALVCEEALELVQAGLALGRATAFTECTQLHANIATEATHLAHLCVHMIDIYGSGPNRTSNLTISDREE